MPSSYSQSLKLELIATGEQLGTWGITTDNNMQLVEQAISGWGYPVFDVDADINVFISDALLSPGRAAVLWVTATATLTAPRSMILSSVPKIWIVHNGTPQIITVKTATGSGVSIIPGGRQQVLCDGVNMVAAFTGSINGQFSLAGVITPPPITASMPDWNPTGLADATIIRVSSSAPTWAILGLVGGTNGRIITLVNVGTVTLMLNEEHSSSSPANRFVIGYPVLWLDPLGAITLMYDAVIARWRVLLPTIDTIPIGTVLDFPGTTLPPRCVWAAGQYLSQTQYARLYFVYGGAWGVSGGNFAVPDLRGRVIAGSDTMNGSAAGRMPGWVNGSVGGELSHVITGNELPYHTHGLNDPTHTHSLYDPTHGHGIGDPSHAHAISDPGHGHGIGDPTHAHSIAVNNQGAFTASGGSLVGGGSPAGTAAAGTGVYTGASGTSIGIYGAGTGVYVGGSGTGQSIYAAATGQTIGYAGANWGLSLIQPTMAMNKIIYAGA